MKRPIAVFCLSTLCATSGAVAAGRDSQVDAAAPALVVHIRDSFFKPDAATVAVGDAVSFVNDDEITHNVTGDRSFDSKDLSGGKSWSYTFHAAGSYKYICTYHPGWMTGQINVTRSK